MKLTKRDLNERMAQALTAARCQVAPLSLEVASTVKAEVEGFFAARGFVYRAGALHRVPRTGILTVYPTPVVRPWIRGGR